jgi:hypothetical protein
MWLMLDDIAGENGGDLSEGTPGLAKALDYIQAEFELLKDTFEVIEQLCSKCMSCIVARILLSIIVHKSVLAHSIL